MGAEDLPCDPAAAALLGRCAIFRRCAADDLAALARAARWVERAPGEHLMLEGDLPEDLYVIAEGEARVLKRGALAAEHEINRLGPDEPVGEMPLFDRVPRSASVRAEVPVRALALPLAHVLALAERRPTLVPVLVDIGALMAVRLRAAADHTAAVADRRLAEERTRAVMGRFMLLLVFAYTSYTWMLGTAVRVKESLGTSEFVTVPAVLICCAILAVFVRVSGYPPRFFGLTLAGWRRHAAEAVVLTLPLMAAAVALKWALVAWWVPMQGEPLFRMGSPGAEFRPWLALAYVVFAPFQELIYRGGVQGSLEHFLTGRWRRPLAIVGANVIFSAAHLYISPGLAVVAFAAGLFWGWLYARQQSLVGVSVSHVLLGFWAFEVVDLGVLE